MSSAAAPQARLRSRSRSPPRDQEKSGSRSRSRSRGRGGGGGGGRSHPASSPTAEVVNVVTKAPEPSPTPSPTEVVSVLAKANERYTCPVCMRVDMQLLQFTSCGHDICALCLHKQQVDQSKPAAHCATMDLPRDASQLNIFHPILDVSDNKAFLAVKDGHAYGVQCGTCRGHAIDSFFAFSLPDEKKTLRMKKREEKDKELHTVLHQVAISQNHDNSHKCPFCPAASVDYDQDMDLLQHLQECPYRPLFKCPLIGCDLPVLQVDPRSVSTNLESHLHTTCVAPFNCPYCKKSQMRYPAFKQHVQAHRAAWSMYIKTTELAEQLALSGDPDRIDFSCLEKCVDNMLNKKES